MATTPDKPIDQCTPLPRHKMAALTFIGLLAPVYFIPQLLSRLLPGQTLIFTILAVSIIVALMNYAIMPILKLVFHGWIKPKA
jgi:antibiotic biosynthesis monooxygenase (ABM) superfamily enzyme